MLGVGLWVNHGGEVTALKIVRPKHSSWTKNIQKPFMQDLELALFILLVFVWVSTQVPLIVSFLLLHLAIGILLNEQQQS